MSRRATIALSFASAALLGLAGCGDDEHVDALGSGGGTTDATTQVASASAATGTSGAGGDAPAPIRTILARDPFGNVAETRNLLWDGDFEWESSFADQYGWLQGQTANLTGRRVGPECRSGLKCAVLDERLIGIAVASADHDLYASVWARPESGGDCEGVRVFLLGEGIHDDAIDAAVPPVAAAPDDTGWCHYEVTAPQRNDKAYLTLSRRVGAATALVDDAVVREAVAEDSARVAPLPFWAPDAVTAAELDEARALIRKWRGPHDDAPNPARDAMQRWARGEGRKRYVASPQVQRGPVKGRGSR